MVSALTAFGVITVGASGGNLLSGVLDYFSNDDDPLGSLAKSMTDVSIILSKGNWLPGPTIEWTDNTTYLLKQTSKVIKDVDLDMEDMQNFNYFLNEVVPNFQNLSNFPNLDPFTENLTKFSNVINNLPDDKHKAITRLSDSIKDFSSALKEVDMSTLDKLSTISQGVMLVSIIDEAKLRGVLDAMSEKEAELKEIYGDEEKEGTLARFSNWASSLVSDDSKEDGEKSSVMVKDDRDLDKEEFYSNIASIKFMIQNMIDLINSPGQSGSFNSK